MRLTTSNKLNLRSHYQLNFNLRGVVLCHHSSPLSSSPLSSCHSFVVLCKV